MAARSRARDDVPTTARPRSDAYTGLLIVSFLALVVGTVFFWLDYSQYPESKPKPAPNISAAAPPPPAVPLPAPGAPGVPPAPPPAAPKGPPAAGK